MKREYAVSFDTENYPGKVEVVTVVLGKRILKDTDAARIDLASHPLYTTLYQYCVSNPPEQAPTDSDRIEDLAIGRKATAKMRDVGYGAYLVSLTDGDDTDTAYYSGLEAALAAAPEHPAVRMLRRVEWCHRTEAGDPACPCCRNYSDEGHAPGCELAKLIGAPD